MTLAIVRTEHSADELRDAARRSKDTWQARRLLAIALVLDSASRTDAARAAGMDRQTLRDWVIRYNDDGIQGLHDRPRPGRPPRLQSAQMADLAQLVEDGPDVAVHGVVRWRCVDLKMEIRPRSRLLKNFASLVKEALPAEALGKPLEIWFQDEARVGQKGTVTRVWARRGTRPRAPRDTRYEWAYIFGAVCPQRAIAAALVLPFANREAMNLHLLEISKAVSKGTHALLVVDGAGWHTSAELKVPDNITLLILPPYAPELNPVENVWQFLRQNKLANRVFQIYEDIVEACCEAWLDFIAEPGRIASITKREWAIVS